MGKLFTLFILFLSLLSGAQQKLIYVTLDTWAQDDGFEKMINPLAFYYCQGDTIFSFDVENVKEAHIVRIKKPEGYKSYAYGYVFFTGVHNAVNPGMMNLLLVDVKERQPRLFIDRNNNFDFTDDGDAIQLPHAYQIKDPVLITLNRSDNKEASIGIRLTRIDFINKYAYKNLLNEYYEFYYKDRKFVGIDYSFREQRFVTRSGIAKIENDSFRIALFDANSNGLYHDIDTDMVLIANYTDTVFDTKDPLHAFTLSKNRKDQYIERNGEQYEILQLNPAGKFMVLKQADSLELFDKIPVGKKIPKFRFIDWQGTKYKISQFRKKEVYIYYTGPFTKNFSQDTTTLRSISDKFGKQITVIAFIDVNKSFELKIFGSYSNLNWIAAFKDKETIKNIRLRGLPSGLWLGKRRKVIRYNITPDELLRTLGESKNP